MWSTASLSFCCPMVRTDRRVAWDLRFVAGELVLDFGAGPATRVRRTSDILAPPWYLQPPKSWTAYIMSARAVVGHFVSMVSSGLIALGAKAVDSSAVVEFNSPLPVIEGVVLPGARQGRFPEEELWVWHTEYARGCNGPLLVVKEAWFPPEMVAGSLK